jgi:hypothetical protein
VVVVEGDGAATTRRRQQERRRAAAAQIRDDARDDACMRQLHRVLRRVPVGERGRVGAPW